MSQDQIEPNTLRYVDAGGVEQEMQDTELPWKGSRGPLQAAASTREGVTAMLDSIEAARQAA